MSAPQKSDLPALDVVIVEDNADARDMLRDLLEMWGHRVRVAEDGLRGVDLLLGGPPDVGLVDIGLTGMDGYEVARQVRERQKGRRTCLIAMTGYGRPEDRRQALASGFDVYLVKPVDPHRLSRLLGDLSAQRARGATAELVAPTIT